tara:strand:+ start:119 stop:466 length:348 start_codon:yes stop_codon:yes gene_type:complete
MNKLLLIPIFATFLSCSSPELEKNVAPELYPTEKCNLTWYGNGELILIDKNHTLPDTIFKSSLNESSEIDLIIRGYYELKINNCNAVNVILTNKNKTLINFNQKTNGLIYQFFNR